MKPFSCVASHGSKLKPKKHTPSVSRKHPSTFHTPEPPHTEFPVLKVNIRAF